MEALARALSLSPWIAEPLAGLAFAALVGLAFAPLELVWPARRRARDRASITTDVLFATVGAIVTRLALLGGLGWVLASVQVVTARVGLGPASPFSDLPAIARIAIGLLLFELGGYAYHRLAHRVPFLWRLHAVHHSATSMDWLAAFRQHPLEIVLMTCAQNLPLVALGVPIGEHALVVLLLAINTVFVHANLRVPRMLELVIATPRFHHRHHDAERATANYATLFPWIDRLFGTHDAASADRFGIDAPPARFLELVTLVYRRSAVVPLNVSPTPTRVQISGSLLDGETSATDSSTSRIRSP